MISSLTSELNLSNSVKKKDLPVVVFLWNMDHPLIGKIAIGDVFNINDLYASLLYSAFKKRQNILNHSLCPQVEKPAVSQQKTSGLPGLPPVNLDDFTRPC
jgi:hypothetical protein